MVTHENLLAVMESRFDFSSARAILSEALTRARVAGRKDFGADDLRAVAAVLPLLAARTEAIVAKLGELADGMGRSGKAPKPAAEPAPAEAAPAEDAPAAEAEPSEEAPAGDEPADPASAEGGAESGEGGEKRRDKQGKKKR